jgi:mitochondrial fission protein ELM1
VGELHQINGGVALSSEDFSADRTQAVRQLNAAGIPAVAVIVLEQNDGYYINADNATATLQQLTVLLTSINGRPTMGSDGKR